MKQVSLFLLSIAVSISWAYAQTGNKAIDGNLTSYTEKVKAGNYFEAMLKLQAVKAITDSLIGVQLADALPKEAGNWVITSAADKGPQRGPVAGSNSNGGTINVTRVYRDKTEKVIPDSVVAMMRTVDPHMADHVTGPMGDGGVMKKALTVTVTNNMMEMATFINSYSETGTPTGPANMPGVSTKSIRIKGYRALATNNKSFNSYELCIIVGSSIIKISGESLTDNSVVDKIAETIDYNKIKAILGE